MILFGCNHYFRFLVFFPPKTGGRLKIALPSSPARVARDELFSSDFLVKFIPHQFNGIYIH